LKDEYTAGRSSTSIASLLGLLVAPFAEVIGSRVDDNSALDRSQWMTYAKASCYTYADNALGTDQFDQLVGGSAFAISLSIGREVAKVANMADLISWSTVCLAMGVDYSILHQPSSK
jgi:hypothetical protein